MTHHCVTKIAHDMFFIGNTFAELYHALFMLRHAFFNKYENSMEITEEESGNILQSKFLNKCADQANIFKGMPTFSVFLKDIISRLRYCSKGDPNYLLNYLL